MTSEDIRIMAVGRAIEFSNHVPTTRSVSYRRISIRQQQLFIRASKINPDWAGVKATAPLVAWDGSQAIDLADLVSPAEAADLVTRIEIADKGTSAYVNGQEVNIVTLADPGCADAPRVVIRNRIVMGYGADLTNVASLAIYYSRIPLPIQPTDGDCDVELYEPHVELLVVDLARHLLQKTIALAPGERTAAIAGLDAEEKDLLDQFDAHVRRFSDATTARFGGSRYAPGAED